MSKRTVKYYLEQHHLDWNCPHCSLPKLNGSFFEDDQQEAHTSSGNNVWFLLLINVLFIFSNKNVHFYKFAYSRDLILNSSVS